MVFRPGFGRITTIAYRNGILAADTQAEAGGWIVPGEVGKIRRIDADTVAAVTGDWGCIEPWLKWYAGDRSSPYDLGEDSRIILAHARDGLTIYQGKGWFKVTAPFAAWGSGWPAAVAAMHMGADAKRAIEVAMLCDPSTGGEVQVVPVRSAVARAA